MVRWRVVHSPEGLRIANPTGRPETRFVVVAIDDRVQSLDAGYTLRIRRL